MPSWIWWRCSWNFLIQNENKEINTAKKKNLIWTFRKDCVPSLDRYTVRVTENIPPNEFDKLLCHFFISGREHPSSVVLVVIWGNSASTTTCSRKKSSQSPEKCLNQRKSSYVKKEKNAVQIKLLVLHVMKMKRTRWLYNSIYR